MTCLNFFLFFSATSYHLLLFCYHTFIFVIVDRKCPNFLATKLWTPRPLPLSDYWRIPFPVKRLLHASSACYFIHHWVKETRLLRLYYSFNSMHLFRLSSPSYLFLFSLKWYVSEREKCASKGEFPYWITANICLSQRSADSLSPRSRGVMTSFPSQNASVMMSAILRAWRREKKTSSCLK